MPQIIRNNVVDEIKSRCNIVDVIGSVVTLKKSGKNYQGLCPFHNEKTPSFVVSDEKQHFTCFGCGTSGDVITFVEKYYNLTFQEALQKLADYCGVKIENRYAKSEKKEIYYEVNKEAATFFFKELRKGENPGLSYMIKRGLSAQTLHTFGIGYADAQWDSLYRFLKGKGYSEDVMLKLGLISQKNGKYYDKFRNRVIFPIQSTTGKVIGFGGRAIGDDMPKYLNSPETPIFYKKNNLYALNITKNSINEKDKAILVEGYMDVISLYQGAVKNVAASLGTALTENQAKLLKRYTKNIVLSYDADNAGINASLRGSDILYKEGLAVKILHISDGKDPDDFIKANGKDAYYELVDNALPYGDYHIKHLKEKYDIATTQGRVDFLRAVAEFLNKLSPVEADIYISKISMTYGISKEAMRRETGQKNEKVSQKKAVQDVKKETAVNEISKIEQNIIKVLITDSRYFRKAEENKGLFKSKSGFEIYKAIESIYQDDEEIDTKKLAELLEPEDEAVLNGIQEGISLGGKIKEVFEECIDLYIKKSLKEEEKEILLQLQLAEEEGHPQKAQDLTAKLIEIQRDIRLGGNKR